MKIQLTFTKLQLKSIGIAAIIVVLIKSLPLLRYASYYYNIAVHELGHSLCAWLFGYISIPTFDFMYGGGVAYHFGRPLLLQITVFVIITALLWQINRYFKNKASVVLAAIWMVYLLIFISQGQDFFIVFMGQGGEIIAGFLLGWFALSHSRDSLDYKSVLYCLLALMIWWENFVFPLRLLFSHGYKTEYIIGKPNVESDLLRLAEMSGLPINFYAIVLFVLSLSAFYLLLKLSDTPFVNLKRLFSKLIKPGIKQS